MSFHRFIFFTLIFLGFPGFTTGGEASSSETYFYIEPVDLLVDRTEENLYVLTSGTQELRKYSLEKTLERTDFLESTVEPKILRLALRPEKMTLVPDQKRLAIVAGGANGALYIVDTEAMTLDATISVGHTPCDVAVFQSTAWVCNRFGGDISVIDLTLGRETARWSAGREPIALDMTRDGKTLVVANHLPEDRAVEGAVSCRVRIFDTATGNVTVAPLPIGTIDLRDIVVEPDGRYAFISCVHGNFEHLPDMVDNGWINENMLAVVDLETGKSANSFSLDGPASLGAANPWGLTLSEDGRFLAVAGSGTDEVQLLSLPKLIQVLDTYPVKKSSPPGPVAASNRDMLESEFPAGVRVPIGVKGIRRLDMVKNRIYFNSYFEDIVGSVDVRITEPIRYEQPHDSMAYRYPDHENTTYHDASSLVFEPLERYEPFPGLVLERSLARLGPKPIWTIIRQGEVLFHDGTICRLFWQSCSSCHPDARTDALNWDLQNDGINNPKNTKSMLLAHETPPSMAAGVRKDAETAVRAGLANILFGEESEEVCCAIDEYLKSLTPVPSPHLVNGALSESAERGKRLFESSKTGCAACHPEPYFTDLEKHNVGTRVFQIGVGKIFDHFDAYDTPTLVEVWRTAPYLHDGRYLTVRDLIVEGNHFAPDDRLKKLTAQEIDDLVEYVLSL